MAEIRIGTSGWHYEGWIGSFYPADVTKAKLLQTYAQSFSTVELNATFYRLPTGKAVEKWRETVGEDFRFAWKASQYITHFKRLKAEQKNIDLLFDRYDILGAKGGTILFQLPPRLHCDAERLARFLDMLPARARYAFEFRHPSWYEANVLEILSDHDVSLCLSDHAHAPAPWEVTASHVYVRPHGPSGQYYGHYEIETLRGWAKQMRRWRGEGRDVVCYFDNDQKSAAPADARKLESCIAGA